MSLLLAGLVFAGTSGGLALGRWLLRRREGAREVEAGADDERRPPADAPPAEDDAKAAKRARPRAPADGAVVLDGFVCQLGDVVIRLTGEEAWLAGGVVLSEEVPVAVLFVAPDAGKGCAIYARSRPRTTIVWLEPLDPSAILLAGEPPSAVEHGGVRYDRARRLPLRARRVGVGAPDVGESALVAEYVSTGAERLLLVKGGGGVHAYRGLELDEGSFEVIASGEDTLGDRT